MGKNKTSKYLKYAIGEIVLVMIGILLALQVNEWNKERNRKKAEQVVIEQLITDLSKSQYELEEEIEYNLREARRHAMILRVFWQNELPDDIQNYPLFGVGSRVYSPVLGTAQSLINSGRLDLFNSKELKNDLVVYVEAVGYNLKDINRYEESYFRKGVELMPSYFGTKESINAESESYKTYWQYRININDRPALVDKVPFETDLEQLFKNEKYFTAFRKLHLYHRNISFRYSDILEVTNNLLVKLYKASYKYQNLGELLNDSNHYLVFDTQDLEILQRADALITEPSKWNRKHEGECDDNTSNDSYSLHCALVKASEEVVGVWEDEPRRPAIRMLRLTLNKYQNRRFKGKPLRDWNNHPDTTFEEVKQVLKESIDEVKKQLQ